MLRDRIWPHEEPRSSKTKPRAEYYPLRLPFTLPFALLGAIGGAFTVIASRHPDDSSFRLTLIPLLALVGLLVGLLVAALCYRAYAIRVGDSEVSGPDSRWPARWSARGVRRVTIDLAELDRPRSAQRSLLDKVLARRYLYSRQGDRILISYWLLRRRDIRALLNVLGVR